MKVLERPRDLEEEGGFGLAGEGLGVAAALSGFFEQGHLDALHASTRHCSTLATPFNINGKRTN
jgi:hypothetical protein